MHQFLTDAQRDRGWSVMTYPDTIELYRETRLIGLFSAYRTTIEEIYKEIDKTEKEEKKEN